MTQNTDNTTVKTIYDLELHEILQIHEVPYFRIMKVPGGWLYNFYDSTADNYYSNWVFVPYSAEYFTNVNK